MIQKILGRLFHTKQATWAERHFTIILIVSAVIAVAMSFAIGLAQSVWFDEAYSIMLAKQPVSQLLHLTALDTHPPLYYLLLKFWAGLFGWSRAALMSLSVIAMGGAVIFGGLLVKKTFGVRTALVTLPFVVFAPFLLRYGFEIRMYALASLIGIAATYVLVMATEAKTDRQKWVRWILYAVLVALGVYTLYYLVLLWVAHVVWLVWVTYKEKKSFIKAPWVLAFIGSVLLFAPWLPTFVKQISNGALAPISQAMTLDNLLGVVSFNFVYQPVWQLGSLLSLLVLFVLCAGSYITIRAFKIVPKDRQKYLQLLACYIFVPIAVLTLVSLARPMYVERYLAHIALGGMLFIGVSVALVTEKASKTVRTSAALLLVVLVVGVAHLVQVGNYNFQRLQKPDIANAATLLKSCETGATILAADPYVAIELSYYVPTCNISFYSKDAKLSGGYAQLSESPLRIGDPVAQLANKKSLFYVYYDQPQLELPLALTQVSEDKFGPLTVARFSAE
jgi:uncharacterized membrane protein